MNEKKSSADNLTLPYSTAMRPSKVTSGPNFINEFSKFISDNMSTKDFKGTDKKSTPKKSAPKKESTPRKESTKTPRKKDIDKTNTTIGLNIEVDNSHDSANAYTPSMPPINNSQPQPVYEAPNHQYVETYPTTHNVMESQTYYNMVPTSNPTPNQINQIPNYVEQPMHMTIQPANHQINGYMINGMNQTAMPNSNVYNYDQNHYGSNNNGMHHQQYNEPTMNYTDQNTQLLTHFNVAHANVTNNPVVHNQMMNWRNGNVIMSE